jgi:hypothetical protein
VIFAYGIHFGTLAQAEISDADIAAIIAAVGAADASSGTGGGETTLPPNIIIEASEVRIG